MTDHFTQHLFERVWWDGFWTGVSGLMPILIVAIALAVSCRSGAPK